MARIGAKYSRKSPAERKTKWLTAPVTQAAYNRLEEYAMELELSQAGLMRTLLTEALEARGRDFRIE